MNNVIKCLLCDSKDLSHDHYLTLAADIQRKNQEKETLRDKFAMSALQAMVISNNGYYKISTKRSLAIYAYEFADEMLKAREQ